MKLYDQTVFGRFIDRPNRFIARVETETGVEVCHVKNTGRCRELLIPGARVTLAVSSQKLRKTRCALVAVHKGSLYINMDSQAPNRAAEEAMGRLFPDLTSLYREKTFGQSRLDFYLEQGEKRTFVEVKGVTLEENGVAMFPDAPTERGIKHLKELENCVRNGYGAFLLLVIQMKGVTCFSPNWKTHPAFGSALIHAMENGVVVRAYDCIVTDGGMTLDQPVGIVIP